jgi:hypothetical protein
MVKPVHYRIQFEDDIILPVIQVILKMKVRDLSGSAQSGMGTWGVIRCIVWVLKVLWLTGGAGCYSCYWRWVSNIGRRWIGIGHGSETLL